MMDNITLWHGDCLEKMDDIEDDSVDMIFADPPFGTVKKLSGVNNEHITHGLKNKTSWDVVIDHQALMIHCNRVLKQNSALILFSQDPYTMKIISEEHTNIPFSYRYTWVKDHFANSLISKVAPVNYTEDVCVFFKKYDTTLKHPLRLYAKKVLQFIGKSQSQISKDLLHQKTDHFFRINSLQFSVCKEEVYQELIDYYRIDLMDGFLDFKSLLLLLLPRKFNLSKGKKYKSNVLEYKKDYEGLHPTQKPLALIEDLIKTYSNKGDIILDFAMGSGTTGVGCKNLDRRFIGIEKEKKYFYIAKNRIANTNPLKDIFGE